MRPSGASGTGNKRHERDRDGHSQELESKGNRSLGPGAEFSYPVSDPQLGASSANKLKSQFYSSASRTAGNGQGGGYDIGVTSLGALYVLFHGPFGGEICSVPGIMEPGALCFVKITIHAYPVVTVSFSVNGVAAEEQKCGSTSAPEMVPATEEGAALHSPFDAIKLSPFNNSKSFGSKR